MAGCGCGWGWLWLRLWLAVAVAVERASTVVEQPAATLLLRSRPAAAEAVTRPRKVAASSATRTAVTATHSALAKKRRAALDSQELREQAADEERVSRWLASRSLSAAATDATAQQRLEQIRNRLRARRGD